MLEKIISIDKSIILFIDKYFTNETMLSVFNFFTILGEHAAVWIVLFIVMAFHKKERSFWLFWGISFTTLFLFSELLLKNLIARPRPFMEIAGLHLATIAPNSFSFPSSHALFSAAALYIFFKTEKNLFFRIIILALAITISLSRVILKIHYPSDVAAGFALGFVTAFAVKLILDKIPKKPS